MTVTTNVPGRPQPLTVPGQPITELLPHVPIALRLRTGVAAVSYGDRMPFGVTADFDNNPTSTCSPPRSNTASPTSSRP